MKTSITIWTLAWDINEGTDCKVFATERELNDHVEKIMRDDISSNTGQEVDSILSLLEAGRVWEAWETWSESLKDALDTYRWDTQPLQIEI